jgi:signal transduction histidine kinase/CheY-like chemotaxis protein
LQKIVVERIRPMAGWQKSLRTAVSPRQRQIAVFSALLLAVAWIDGTRPFHRDWSTVYFVPLCYVGWHLTGRLGYSLLTILFVTVFAAPLCVNPAFFANGTRAIDRFVGVIIGIALYEMLRRIRGLNDQLEAANQHLESRVAARTLELQRANAALQAEIVERRQAQLQQHETQQQLLQSQKMEVVGRFAGGIAHDFNNMLTVILGYACLLLDQIPPDGEQKKSLLAIKHAGERAANLTRQLLVFSRHNVVQTKVVQLNDLIRETENMLRPLIPESIDLVVDLCPNPPLVDIDPAQFSQVLVNLAVNARDAMPTGGRLMIRTGAPSSLDSCAPSAEESHRAGYVVMEVADTGCGMTPEIRARIFEPFFTTKSAGKGVGLGLSIVDGIVRQSQGKIEVRSIPGQGTNVRILLPPTTKTETSSILSQASLGDARGETILLVEDEDPLRKLAVYALRNAGYQVTEACNGSEACEKAEQLTGGIDLLLTDVVMPGMSGRQLSDRLQSSHPEMKVLYVSGYNEDAIVAFGVVHETVHFLTKPFSPRELAQKVRHVLNSDKGLAAHSETSVLQQHHRAA